MSKRERSAPDLPEEVDWAVAISESCEVSVSQAAEALAACNGDVEDACDYLIYTGTAAPSYCAEPPADAVLSDLERSQRIKNVAHCCDVSKSDAAAALDRCSMDVEGAVDLLVFGNNIDVDIARVEKVDPVDIRSETESKTHRPTKPRVSDACWCVAWVLSVCL